MGGTGGKEKGAWGGNGASGGGVGFGVRTGGDLVLWMMAFSSHDGIDG